MTEMRETRGRVLLALADHDERLVGLRDLVPGPHHDEQEKMRRMVATTAIETITRAPPVARMSTALLQKGWSGFVGGPSTVSVGMPVRLRAFGGDRRQRVACRSSDRIGDNPGSRAAAP
jgi:hypothetical protein